MIISVANHKGGVAKTTTALNLGAALARKGYNVLLIDSDEQANLSEFLGRCDEDAEQGTLVDAYTTGQLSIQEVSENLSLVSANLSLGFVASNLKDEGVKGYTRLKEVLAKVSGQYDYIFIDCPPAVSGMLISNAFVASDYVLIPCVPEKGAVKGIGGVLRLIDNVLPLNGHLSVVGIVLTKVQANTATHKANAVRVANDYPEVPRFDQTIRQNIVVSEAQEFGVDIFSHNASSAGAEDYQSLCNEFLERLTLS